MDNQQGVTTGGQDPQGQDPQGQDPQGQGQRGQGQERAIREAIRMTPVEWRFPVEPSRFKVAQVADVLDSPRLGPQDRDTIELTLIIPGPYKKFRATVSVTQEALTMDIFSNTADDFPLPVLNAIWGNALMGVVREPGATWQLRLRQDAIWAVARSNASLSIFFKNHETDFRCMVVLIPKDDLDRLQRTRLTAFGRTLCRWAFPNQLVHYNPKMACPAYAWLMQQARGSPWSPLYSGVYAWPVANLDEQSMEEQVLREQGLFDTDIHYLYDRNLPVFDLDQLYRHAKYELKKALAIVAHRLFTRLQLDRSGSLPEAHRTLARQGNQEHHVHQVYRDCVDYRSSLTQYKEFYPTQVQWDDPANRNDAPYDPPPNLEWIDGQIQELYAYRQVPLDQLIDYTLPVYQPLYAGYSMRMYWSLVDRWNVVERVEYYDTHLLVYVVESSGRREHCLKVTYENILYVRLATTGTKSFSIHQHVHHWGYVHFECQLSTDITALRDVTLSHLRAHQIDWQQTMPVEDESLKIGPLSRALFPLDPTIAPEPALYWAVCNLANADTEIGKNYLSLACRLINKLAIQLVDSIDPATGELDMQDRHVLNMWNAYWHSRQTILPESRLHSNLPHLVRFQLGEQAQVFRMRHRWAYTTFDAPNER